MSNKTQNIRSFQKVYPQIYSYELPNRSENEGSQKIGYTERKNVDERIKEQTQTAAIREDYNKLWSAPAFFEGNEESFTDKSFHDFLIKSGIEKRKDLGTEWFFFNGFPEKSKELFDLFKEKRFAALQNDKEKREYILRDEQEEAIVEALEYFENNENGEFLWNAKPRFGKTLSAYDLAKRLKAEKVLIVTNRPAIANSWFDDYEMFIDGYAFISETSSLNNRATFTREQYVENIKTAENKSFITFLSLQDLKGSKYLNKDGNHDKLRWVADLDWDLLIVDESHEGVDTEKTYKVFENIKRKHTLHLSGTPFKALANEKFPKDAIFNWTYLDEQLIKQIELEEDEIGEHTDLPDLKLFTYRISQMITDQVNEGIEIDNEIRDYAFDLNEFFRTDKQKFVYEKDVKKFLNNLTTNKKYPFSTPELRAELKHTFWYVGNRVDSVKALAKLLKEDEVFKNYEIVIAAGDGKSFEEEENDFKANETSFQKVKKAIAENDKTITLSCGQLTTGVTIKEWTAVLMLTDIKSSSLYMQAAFRAQNPFKELRNNDLYVKKSAYLFDFAPTRVLEIYHEFANGLNPKAVSGEITEKEKKENIRELLNFFPVISEDVKGEMIELDAEKVLTFPNALAASEIVNARFMTNLLFSDTISKIFNFPKEVEEILDKLQVEKNKRIQKAKNPLDFDEAREINNNKTNEINQNRDIILGEKIYLEDAQKIIDHILEKNNELINPYELTEKVTEVAEPLIAKYKEVYKATKAETDEVTKQIQEKIKEIAEEYNATEEKDTEALKEKLINTIEVDFVQNKVKEKEEEKVEKVQKSKENEIRDRLRSFTRTIPMFIMANDSKEEITIDNFDTEIDDNDFLELTSITKEEFHKLRDGFDYEEDGEIKTFQGVFNKYRFNASIAEFRRKKEELADYFEVEEDIFELIPNQKTNQIFTPKNVVQMMIDNLEEHDASLFTRTDSTFIDLYMKSGMYITEIVKKLFYNTRSQYRNNKACLKHILENQVYGLSPTPILQGITQTYIFGFDTEHNISRKNFIQHDITPEAQENKAKEKLQELFNINKNMKFDAVVGNPPYQEDSGTSARDEAIYNYFYDLAEKVADKYCLISPARFLFNAGSTSKKWNKKMLNDIHLKVIFYEHDSKAIFNNVGIAGGVVILFRDAEKDFGAIGTFTNFEELNSISLKVGTSQKNALTRIISGRGIYRLTSILHEQHPEVADMQSKGHKDDVGTGAFSIFKDQLFFEKKPEKGKQYTRVYGRLNNQRTTMWIQSDYINKPYAHDKYRVILPKAYGTGISNKNIAANLIGRPFVIKPYEAFTEMYISIGDFEQETSANNALKYLKTKFARTLLAVLKITQDNTKEKWSKVPLQDFTSASDIDWSKSISEIDQQLYQKYGLSGEEIAFIEEKVQPMGD